MTAHNQWLSKIRSIPSWTTISAHKLSGLLISYFSYKPIRVKSYVTTNGQSASLSWNKAPIRGLPLDLYYCQTVTGLLMSGALSDKRTCLPFTIAVGHCQRCHSRVRGNHCSIKLYIYEVYYVHGIKKLVSIVSEFLQSTGHSRNSRVQNSGTEFLKFVKLSHYLRCFYKTINFFSIWNWNCFFFHYLTM
jgi:hypothetical protein